MTTFPASELAPGYSPPFRGEIYDYASQLDLQSGYSYKGRFDITTCLHIKEPLEAIRDPSVRVVSILKAVQTLGTLVGELTIPYLLEHDPGDILMLYEDDPKAKMMSDTRLMKLICSAPGIAKMLPDVNRHDKTKTTLKVNGCHLVVCGMNPGNVQSLSYRYVIADEVWLSRANGMVRQAMDRTRQFRETCKIILIGQGGWEGEDHDTEHRKTDMRELNWQCPHCGAYQPFELSRLRPDSHPIESLRGTYAGLSWDTNDSTYVNGRWNFNEVKKTAHHRCFDCDHRIEDDPTIRRRLMESYKYIPTNPRAPHELVGFHWPSEASTRLTFSDQVEKYLRAKVAKEEMGNTLPMQEFYQKDRAVHWSPEKAMEYRAIVQDPYDATSDWPEEKHRPMFIDCQKDLAKFHVSIFRVSLSGECREIYRGTVGSFQEIAEIQKKHGVKDQQVFLDCSYRMTDVLAECTKHFHVGKIKVGGREREVKLCWTGLKGSGSETFSHAHPKNPNLRDVRVYSQRKMYNVNEGKSSRPLYAPYWEWSNLHCKDMLRARRDGEKGVPKLLTLPDTLPQEDEWSHFRQMRSEYRKEEFANGKKRSIWLPVKDSRPNHWWDVGAMLMAFLAISGIASVGGDVDGEE